MDEESTRLLREIRDLIAANNAQQASWMKIIWRLLIIVFAAIPVAFVVAGAIGLWVEHNRAP